MMAAAAAAAAAVDFAADVVSPDAGAALVGVTLAAAPAEIHQEMFADPLML